MALANYVDLLASVANWIHRAGDTTMAALIPDLVTLAEARIGRDLRIRKQIVSTNLASAAGVRTVALPLDFLELENVSIIASPVRQLVYVTVEQMEAKYDSARVGLPAVYTIEGDNILFAPTPDAVYPVETFYYAMFPALAANSTNWLMTKHPGVYLWACLAEASVFMSGNKEVATWEAKYQHEKDTLQQQDDRATHSGSVLRVKTL
jgi:hypothetical protein